MPKKTKKVSYFGKQALGRGLVVSDNPILAGGDAMTVADNILVSSSLSRKKRGGTVSYHTGTFTGTASYPATGAPIRSIFEFNRYNASGTLATDIVLHRRDAFWTVDDRNTVAVDRTGSLPLVADDSKISWQPMNSNIYFVSDNTAEGYAKWDGVSATASAVTGSPKVPLDGVGKYLTIYNNRMVMAGVPGFEYRVYLSVTGDPEDWEGDDATSLDLDFEGDPNGITGIYGGWNNALIVFTRRSIYLITGNTPASFQVKKISSGIGCISHQSIASVGSDIYFASEKGVHSLLATDKSQDIENTFVSRDIQKLWTDQLNTLSLNNIHAVYDEPNNNYVVAAPSAGSSTNDTILNYNIEFGIWTVWTDQDPMAIATALIANKPRIICGRQDGTISLMNDTATTTDFGSGFTGNFKTGIIYPNGDMTRQHVFKSITVLASAQVSSAFTISVDVDGKGGPSRTIDLTQGAETLGPSGTFTLGASILSIGQFLPVTMPIDSIGYGMQVQIISSGVTDYEVYGFVIEYEDANEMYD